jgi:hypothetical protein
MSISKRSVLYLFIVIAVLYAGALIFGWFDNYRNFDSFIHLLGGVWTGLLFILFFGSFFSHEAYAHIAERVKILILGVAFGAFVGTLWEFFEYLLNVFFDVYLQPSIGDTMGDLLIDMIGAAGVCAWFLFMRERIGKKPRPQNLDA